MTSLLSFFPFGLFTAAMLLSTQQVGAQTWSQVPSPNPGTARNILRAISGTSSSDVWAVGDYNINVAQLTSDTSKNLIMHWNGTGWQTFPGTEFFGTYHNLWDVKAITANNAWAVGIRNSSTSANPSYQLLHWTGTAWSHEFISNPPAGSALYDMVVLSPTDIWAVGERTPVTGGTPALCFAIRYNGSTWSEVPVPPVGTANHKFNSIDGVAANDLWAVGGQTSGGTIGSPEDTGLIMHWDGSAWSNVASPAINKGPLLDVEAVATNDVWAVGYRFILGGPYLVHWDGTSWTDVLIPNTPPTLGELLSVPVSNPTNNLYSFGGEIGRLSGSTWSIIHSLSQHPAPNLSSAMLLPNGEIWAAGRTMDPQGSMNTLVYRMTGGTPPARVQHAIKNTPVLQLSPNPARGAVTMSLREGDKADLRVEIIDFAGRLMFSETIAPATTSLPQLDLSEWPNGVYFVKTLSESGTAVQKLIVQH